MNGCKKITGNMKLRLNGKNTNQYYQCRAM